MVSVVRPLQPEKAVSPMLVRPSGSVIDVKPEQLLKTLFSRTVTPSGTTSVVRPEQPLKALPPMLVTPAGNVNEVKPLQPEKAFSSMLVTLEGRVISFRKAQLEKTFVPIFVAPSRIVTDSTLPALRGEYTAVVSTMEPKETEVTLLPKNKLVPRLVTLSGMYIEVRPVQYWNAR